MTLTKDELIEICSAVTTMLGSILAKHVELNEGLIDQFATDAAEQKVDRLKQQTADAKEQLQKLRDLAARKRQLFKIRNDHEREVSKPKQTEGKSTQSRVALLNGKGKWIGWIESLANGNVNIYDARGRIVARELSGITLDRTGRFVGRGKQGLVVRGQSLKA